MSSSLTPAVLRCLVIGEILQVVVDELDTSDYTGKIKRRTLASLAQTCKALYAAYIPGLWESQDNLEPFLQFFPPHIQTETLLPGAKTAFVCSSCWPCLQIYIDSLTVSSATHTT